MDQDIANNNGVLQVTEEIGVVALNENASDSECSSANDNVDNVNVESDNESLMGEEQSVYTEYKPLFTTSSEHPSKLCESTALFSINTDHHLQSPKSKPTSVYTGEDAPVSNVQIQAAMMMKTAHEQYITVEPGRMVRQGFINGDGPGVGKTRELCFGIKEYEAEGKKKHVWITTSNRLIGTIKKELKKVKSDLKVIKVGKINATAKIAKRNGVAVMTYKLLSSGTPVLSKTGTKKGRAIKSNKSPCQQRLSSKRPNKKLLPMTRRYKQLYDWMTKDGEFDGLLILDECHSAKAFYQESTRVSKSKRTSQQHLSSSESETADGSESEMEKNQPELGSQTDDESPDECQKQITEQPKLSGSKTHQTVVRLQNDHPDAKVVYSSATCASEIEHYGYMVRLGLWAFNKRVKTAHDFIENLRQKGRVAIEFLTMTLKRKGLLIARQLSFEGVKFDIQKVPQSDTFEDLWKRSSEMWTAMFRNLQYKFDGGLLPSSSRKSKMSKFWISCQRYFKTLIYASKIQEAASLGKKFVAENKYAVVYGLQGTGECGAKDLDANHCGAYSLSRHELKQGLAAMGIKIVNSVIPQERQEEPVNAQSEESGYAKVVAEQDDNKSDGDTDSSYTSDDSDADTSDDSDDDSDDEEQSSSEFNINKCSVDLSEESTEEETQESDSDSEKERKQKMLALSEQMQKTQSEIDSLCQSASESKKRKLAQKKSDKKRSCQSVQTADTQDEILNTGSVIAEKETANEKQEAEVCTLEYPDGTLGWSRRAKVRYNPLPTNINTDSDEYLIYLFDEIENWLPVNPLDNLIRLLGGPQEVAEMTGRKIGNMYIDRGSGDTWKAYNRTLGIKKKGKKVRASDLNNKELKQFQNGIKKFAIISDCASTGLSMHSDLKNPIEGQRTRKHIQLEFPWSPDKTIQQLGRTNRSNQATPAEYILLQSVVPCEIRFESVVASRLKNLGASCHADGDVNPLAGLISDKNYESCGKKALAKLKRLVSRDDHKPAMERLLYKLCHVGFLKRPEGKNFCFETGMGTDITKLLNRAMLLPLKDQQKVIDLLDKLIAKVVREEEKTLKRASTVFVFDSRFTVTELKLDRFSDAESSVFLGQYQVSRLLSWVLLNKYTSGGKPKFFTRYWTHNGKGNIEILCALKLMDGYGIFYPWNRIMSVVKEEFFSHDGWKVLPTTDDPQPMWEKQHEEMKTARCIHSYRYGDCEYEDCRDDWGITFKNVLYGDILDVWSHVQDLVQTPKIVKFRVSHGNGKPKTFVFGVKIPHNRLDEIKRFFRHLNVELNIQR